MSGISTVNADFALQQGLQGDPIQRKLDMDALRKRLGDTATKQEKLREACEGFEAVFIQKMWEQMRKTVPKEGYLHSKDEEMYQSLFDVELSKKMAGAGGIGLADMLYQQLSQQLEDTGRTTTPSSYRSPLGIQPSEGLMAAAVAVPQAPATPAENKRELKAEDLYSPLEEEPSPDESEAEQASALDAALHELRADLGLAPADAPGSAAAAWAEERDLVTGVAGADSPKVVGSTRTSLDAVPPPAAFSVPEQPTAEQPATEQAAAPSVVAAAEQPVAPAVAVAGQSAAPAAAAATPAGGTGLPKPDHLFAREQGAAQASAEPAAKAPQTPPRGMVPPETIWPLANEGTVTSGFGWEDIPGANKRRWNSGVRIEAPAGTPVRAILSGTVVYAGERDGYGNTLVLEHGNGYRSYYSNLADNNLQIGSKVRHGAEIAQIAAQTSPSANGENSASLYFELKKGEMAINPESAIKRLTAGTAQQGTI